MGESSSWYVRMLSPMYTWLLVLFYIAYVGTALGTAYVSPESVHILTVTMQVFIGIVLAIRFHPWQVARHVTEFDQRLIFASAFMLLINAGLAGILIVPLHNLARA